jgi:hypothetical protein
VQSHVFQRYFPWFELKSGFIVENYRSLFFGIEINKIEIVEFFDDSFVLKVVFFIA